MTDELEAFLGHERRHRAVFGAELERRGRPRCRSYHLCGLGGFALGALTGFAGRRDRGGDRDGGAAVYARSDGGARGRRPGAAATLRDVIADEQEHHDLSDRRLAPPGLWPKLIDPIIAASTEAVIWLGMRL